MTGASDPFAVPPLPAWVRVTRDEPLRVLNLTRLAEADKRAHWKAIKRQRPALAALLTDPVFRSLVDAFSADVCVRLEDLPHGDD